MNQKNSIMPHPTIEKFGKIMRLALDPAALDGESQAATLKAVSILRKDNISYYDLWRLLMMNPPFPEGQLRFQFGKHEGKSIAEVYQVDPDYLHWVEKKWEDNPSTVAAIKRFLKEVPKRPEN